MCGAPFYLLTPLIFCFLL